VSVTLARDEIPVAVGLRLFLPEAWGKDAARRARAYVPEDVTHRPKWKIALDEVDRLIDSGVRFGDVLADAGYGMCGEFRNGLTERKLLSTVGILSSRNTVAPAYPTPRAPASARWHEATARSRRGCWMGYVPGNVDGSGEGNSGDVSGSVAGAKG
jgi:SRSO17 transposase